MFGEKILDNSKTKHDFFQNYFKILGTVILITMLFLAVLFMAPSSANTLANALYVGTASFLLAISVYKFRKIQEGKIVLVPLIVFAFFNLLGHLTWAIHEGILKIHPFPSVADAFWFTSYFGMIAFLVLYFRQTNSKTSKIMKLFGIITASLFLVPPMVFLQGPHSYTALETLLVIIYPVMVAFAVFLVVSHMYKSVMIKASFLSLFFLGLTSLLVSHSFYVISADYFVNGNPVDLGWIIGYVVMSFALLRLGLNTKDISSPNDISNFKFSFEEHHLLLVFLFKVLAPVILTAITVVSLIVIAQHVIEDGNADDVYLFVPLIATYITTIVVLLIILNKYIKKQNESFEKISSELREEIGAKTKQLVKQEKLASVGQTASRLGHDLRNPLSLINMSVGMLKAKNSKQELQKYQKHYDSIETSIHRMIYQIENVLDFVREKPLNKKLCSLQEIIGNAVQICNVPEGIKIKLPEKDYKVLVDQIQIETVMINLVTNSIQSLANQGTITIDINKIKNIIRITVVDSGSGIAKENMDKIFEPLFTTKQTGTGLGLSGCKNIIERHGGTISVFNNPTTFAITLPYVQRIPFGFEDKLR